MGRASSLRCWLRVEGRSVVLKREAPYRQPVWPLGHPGILSRKLGVGTRIARSTAALGGRAVTDTRSVCQKVDSFGKRETAALEASSLHAGIAIGAILEPTLLGGTHMTKLAAKLQTLRNEKGATAVEYGLMVALIAVIIIVAVAALGTNLSTLFDEVADSV